MNFSYRIELVDHRILDVAQKLHAVQMRAYAQEAKLLGAIYFPPLERTVEELQGSTEQYRVAIAEEEILGAISVCPDEAGMGINVASLVVSPQVQRRGIGRALMSEVLSSYGSQVLTVQTGVKNIPALSLYWHAGFVELRRWLVGREPLELIKLRRHPPVHENAA